MCSDYRLCVILYTVSSAAYFTFGSVAAIKKFKLQFRITRTFVLLLIMLVLVACSCWMLVDYFTHIFTEQANTTNSETVALAADIIDERINAKLMQLQALAYLPPSEAVTEETVRKKLAELAPETNKMDCLRISLSDASGNAYTTDGQKFFVYGEELYFKALSGFATTSGVFLDMIPSENKAANEIVVLEAPVFSGADVVGTISATFTLEDLSRILAGINMPYSGAALFIIDSENCVIAHSGVFADSRMYIGRSCSFFNFMSGILSAEESKTLAALFGGPFSSEVRSYKAKQYDRQISYVGLRSSGGWKLVTVSSEGSIHATQQNILDNAKVLFLFVVCLSTVIFALFYIAAWKYQRERKLSQAAMKMTAYHTFMLAPNGDASDVEDSMLEFLGLDANIKTFNFADLMDKNQPLFPLDSLRNGDSFRIRVNTPDNRRLYILLRIISDSENGRYQAFAMDVTADEVIQDRVRTLAYTDQVTGLPNKKSLFIKIDELGRKCLRQRFKCVFYFIDVNSSHKIITAFGDGVFNGILEATAKRLSVLARKEALTLYCLGKDEFVLLDENHEEDAKIEYIDREIKKKFTVPFNSGNNVIEAACHVGVVVCTEYTRQEPIKPEDIIRYGEIVMVLAKDAPPENVEILDIEKYHSVLKELDMGKDMPEAIRNNEFVLYYQPIYNAETNLITCVEALLRWNSPKYGFVKPGEFIPIAEREGVINQLGDHAIDLAFDFAKKVAERGIRTEFNVSSIQMMQSNFVDRLLAKFQGSGLPPQSVGMEITESCFLENMEETKQKLKKVREAGMFVLIDDFGTGYSSLSYLGTLPADYLKIDKSFIDDINTSEKRRAIVDSIVNIANSIEMLTVAEGVETMEQLDVVLRCGCTNIQGYIIAQPMPEDETLDFIEKFNKRTLK